MNDELVVVPGNKTVADKLSVIILDAALVDNLHMRCNHSDRLIMSFITSAASMLVWKYLGDDEIRIVLNNTIQPPGNADEYLKLSISGEIAFRDFVRTVRDKSNNNAHKKITMSQDRVDLVISNIQSTDRLLKKETVELAIDISGGVISLHLVHSGQCPLPHDKLFLENLVFLLNQLVDDPSRKLSEYDFVSPSDKALQLDVFSRAVVTESLETVTQRLDCIARVFSDRIALRYENETITYAEFHNNIVSVATALIKHGVTENQRVVLFMDRSIEMITALFGIMKANCAYVPVDPEFPAERIDYILSDSQSTTVVTSRAVRKRHQFPVHFKIMYCEDILKVQHEDTPNRPVKPTDLAYVIYTSASTGKPKGVCVRHNSVVSFVDAMRAQLPISEQTVALAVAPISFDLSVSELMVPLLSGATVVIGPTSYNTNLGDLKNAILTFNVNTVHFTPSRLKLLFSDGDYSFLKRVDYLLVGGEQLPQTLYDELSINYSGVIVNLYGPTETTVWSTIRFLTGHGAVDIGRPLINTDVFIVDDNLRLVPCGATGQLAISGSSVSNGYLNNATLTNDKFVPNIFRGYGVLYKTGDLARWNPDGNLEYFGRSDFQVKIQGFRIELGEIEHALEATGMVSECAVVAVQNPNNISTLRAFFTSTKEVDTAFLNVFLQKKLPYYMIPSTFLRMEQLPRTHNGKLDRSALMKFGQINSPLRVPTDGLEVVMRELWIKMLDLPGKDIGGNTNFFDAGGNSMKAIHFLTLLEEKTGKSIPLHVIFAQPTLEQLVRYVSENKRDEPINESGAENILCPAAPMQKRLWFIQKAFPEDRSFIFRGECEMPYDLDQPCLQLAIDEIVHSQQSLRTKFFLKDGGIMQMVNTLQKVKINFIDVSNAPEPLERYHTMAAQWNIPFDVDSDEPLIRVHAVKLGVSSWRLLYFVHHIVFDRWSADIFSREIRTRYENVAGLTTGKVEDPTMSYAQYVSTYIIPKNSLSLNPSYAFWLEKLTEGYRSIDLPCDFAPKVGDNRSAIYKTFFDGIAFQNLNHMSAKWQAPLSFIITAVYALWLSSVSKQKQVSFYIISSGRGIPAIKNTIGYFTNALPVTISVENCEEFSDLVAHCKSELLDILKHELFPYDLVAEKLGLPGPSLNTALNFVDASDATAVLEEKHTDDGTRNAWFSIEPYFRVAANGIQIDWHYKRSEFAPETFETLSRMFIHLLGQISESNNAL